MKLIFVKNVGGVAQAGVIKDVSDGYALNYLIPRGMAVQATPKAIADHKKRYAAQAKQDAHDDAKRKEDIDKLEGATFVLRVRTNDNRHLYQQLSPHLIADAIKKEKGVPVPLESIHVPGHIKTTGEYEGQINLGSHRATIKLSIIADQG